MNALILIDIQNDFLLGGSLEVPKGDEIIDNIGNSSLKTYIRNNVFEGLLPNRMKGIRGSE